jgi:hypothetical protein
MCGLCGVVDLDPHWRGDEIGRGETPPHVRRRERRRVIALASAFLRPYRIAVEDFEGTAFVVRGPTGAAEIVPALPQVWRAAERMSGRRLDPLARPDGL